MYRVVGEGIDSRNLYKRPQEALLYAIQAAKSNGARMLRVLLDRLSASETRMFRVPPPAMAFTNGKKLTQIVCFLSAQ